MSTLAKSDPKIRRAYVPTTALADSVEFDDTMMPLSDGWTNHQRPNHLVPNSVRSHQNLRHGSPRLQPWGGSAACIIHLYAVQFPV